MPRKRGITDRMNDLPKLAKIIYESSTENYNYDKRERLTQRLKEKEMIYYVEIS